MGARSSWDTAFLLEGSRLRALSVGHARSVLVLSRGCAASFVRFFFFTPKDSSHLC